jgi:hypothetical protein
MNNSLPLFPWSRHKDNAAALRLRAQQRTFAQALIIDLGAISGPAENSEDALTT